MIDLVLYSSKLKGCLFTFIHQILYQIEFDVRMCTKLNILPMTVLSHESFLIQLYLRVCEAILKCCINLKNIVIYFLIVFLIYSSGTITCNSVK